MNTPNFTPEARGDQLVAWIHRGCLAFMVACVIFVALQDEQGSDDPPPADYTVAVVGLAVGSILARRLSTSPRLAAGARQGFAAAGLLLAAAIGIAALTLVQSAGEKQNALLFVLGGGILCLRPPASLGRSARASD